MRKISPMRHYHIYQFTTTSEEQKDILIARLMAIGFDGVEETAAGFTTSVETTGFDADAFNDILQQIPAAFTCRTEEEQNWNSRWEEDFQPVSVGDFASIRASFHPIPEHVQHDIIITPKMSFGTGHHATTWMMIAQMQTLNFNGKTVFDFGTGTGVLAILARKMGATAITAIDNDEWSINNAKENFTINDCQGITLSHAETPPRGVFDIILANINLNILVTHMRALADATVSGGLILISGILTTDETDMRKVMEMNGLNVVSVTHRNDWCCIKAQKRDG